MQIVSSSIPNLINGVSQQPFALRLPSQAEEQINGYSSVSEGLIKRPNTDFVSKISSSTNASVYTHVINRDIVERYVVLIIDGDLKVYDFNGIEQTVNFPNGKSYLSSTDTNKGFASLTVADFTFIVNKEVKTAMDSQTASSAVPQGMVWVRQGNYSTRYRIRIDGSSVANYTTPNATTDATDATAQKNEIDAAASAIQTEAIASELRSQLQSNGYSVGQWGSVLRIRRSNNADFSITSEDSLGDQALLTIKDQVQAFTSLPKRGVPGFQVEITGTPTNAFDNYFVQYNDAPGNEGIWEEIAKPGRLIRLKRSTMPHALIREADGTFTFRELAWSDCKSGDENTNEPPSMIGKTINDTFFFRNRLGIISDENVIFSKAGDFFNFWRGTVTSLLNDDPVDVAVSHTKVSILKYAIPFNESLLLFSDRTQFNLVGGESLTPATVAVSQTTEFEADMGAKPVGAGRYVYFPFFRGNFSGVREYFVDGQSDIKDAAEISSHVPSYIPKGVYKLAISTNEDVLITLTSGKRNELYVYKYFYDEQTKVQSSWSKWVFPEDDQILDMEMIESSAWLVIQRPDGIYMERMELETGRDDDGLGYAILLDRRCRGNTLPLTFNAPVEGSGSSLGTTTVSLPWAIPEGAAVAVVAAPGNVRYPGGYLIPFTTEDAYTVSLEDDQTGGAFYVGLIYEMRYTFSPLLLRSEAPGGGQIAVTEGRLQLSFMNLVYSKSGYFRVEVTPTQRPTYTRVMAGSILGSATSILGERKLEEGRFRFPIFGNNMNMKVEIINDSHLPCRFLSAEWEGKYTVRSLRRQ